MIEGLFLISIIGILCLSVGSFIQEPTFKMKVLSVIFILIFILSILLADEIYSR